MKVWKATLDISFQLTTDRIKKNAWLSKQFADPENPTDAEVKKYFLGEQDNYAGCNDGSELLANADMTITCTEK